jgi:3',5'-nucleoside bisphosphate phosphatase
MITDLHIHSNCSDGKYTVEEIFYEARSRNIGFLSITDHDSIGSQFTAISLATTTKIRYLCGVELNVAFSNPIYREGKSFSLDFLGYQFDPNNRALLAKLETLSKYRQERATKILENLNSEFTEEGIDSLLTEDDFREIESSADGAIGRPHIADYLVKKGIVKNRQEAFDKYLVKCDVPKYPLFLKEASTLIRNAGGKLVLAHPNDPNGTSLAALTKTLSEQTKIVQDSMLDYIDGVECWHSRHDSQTTSHYVEFAKAFRLILTGGSDCHQKPVLMGTTGVPELVANQF